VGQGHAVVVGVVLLGACSDPVALECESWTWIEEESCLMDTCAEQAPEVDEVDSECRAFGECWCCDANECWFSGRFLTD